MDLRRLEGRAGNRSILEPWGKLFPFGALYCLQVESFPHRLRGICPEEGARILRDFPTLSLECVTNGDR